MAVALKQTAHKPAKYSHEILKSSLRGAAASLLPRGWLRNQTVFSFLPTEQSSGGVLISLMWGQTSIQTPLSILGPQARALSIEKPVRRLQVTCCVFVNMTLSYVRSPLYLQKRCNHLSPFLSKTKTPGAAKLLPSPLQACDAPGSPGRLSCYRP